MTQTLDELEQNMQQCWRCSHCKWVPSMTEQRFNKICPSMEWGEYHAYSGGGKVITAYALRKGDVPYTDKMLESVFACTMCGACDVACKSNNAELVEPLDILYALRARIAADGKSLPAHLALIESLRAHGNPHGKPASEPTKMMVKRAAPGGEGFVVDPYSPDALRRYLAPFDKAFAQFPRGLVRSQFHDSFEYYNASWTAEFAEVFEAMHGEQQPEVARQGQQDAWGRQIQRNAGSGDARSSGAAC